MEGRWSLTRVLPQATRAALSRSINETATARHDAFASREIQDGTTRTAGDVAGPPFLQEKAAPPALAPALAASQVPSRYAAGHARVACGIGSPPKSQITVRSLGCAWKVRP